LSCHPGTASYAATLKFISKDCDPETFEPDEEGYPDEYAVRRRSRAMVITRWPETAHAPSAKIYIPICAHGQLETVEVSLADYMLPHHINNFKQAWDDLDAATEVTETFQLTSMTSLTSTAPAAPA